MSWSLSENAIAWTTKSSEPQADFDRREGCVERRLVGHVAMTDDQPADLLGERLDAFLQGVALIGEGEFGAVLRAALAMPQAIERLFATPMIRPRLPRMRPELPPFTPRRRLRDRRQRPSSMA